MDNFLDSTWSNNSVIDWLQAVGIIIISILAARLIYFFFKKILSSFTAKTKTNLDDMLLKHIQSPFIFGIIVAGISIGLSTLYFPEGAKAFIKKGTIFLFTVDVTWFIARFSDAILEEYLKPYLSKSSDAKNDHLLPIIGKFIKIAIWSIGIIIALNNAGYDVGALIAGLGIGGIAFAMAAKDSLSNFFGGITVFVDKPFKINDRIKVNGYEGFVRDIGIRSTRIQTLEGRIITIPNGKFTDSEIENISGEPTRKVILNLGLTYNTTPEQMKLAQELLKKISEEHKDLIDDNVLMSFNSFGDFSLGILFIYYIRKGSDILETQNQMNLSILTAFNANNLDFAFPTQTIITSQG